MTVNDLLNTKHLKPTIKHWSNTDEVGEIGFDLDIKLNTLRLFYDKKLQSWCSYVFLGDDLYKEYGKIYDIK